MNKLIHTTLLLLVLLPCSIWAKGRQPKVSALGGPGYTPDFGFLIGGSALLTFKANPADTVQLRSVVPLAVGLTFGQGFGVNATLYPQFYLMNDRIRLTGRFIYKNTGDNYYGVGYHENSSRIRGLDQTRFYSSMIQINPSLLFRIPKTNLFVGPAIDYVQDRMTKIAPYFLQDPHYVAQGGTADGLKMNNLSFGLNASYDSRDVPSNAYRGFYLDGKLFVAHKSAGSDFSFMQFSLDYRQYISVGERKTIAWTVQTKNAFGDVPLTRMPLVGSPFDLRGYYLGQYRDKSTHLAVAEYRHMFNNDRSTKIKRLFARVGFAAWGGVGMMGPSIGKIEGVLPNFGAGLRIEVQPRMNFRLDVGYSPKEGQALIYFNMTEAF